MGAHMTPLIRWVGGKAWLLSAFNHIVGNTPYTRLVELFAGGAAISLGRNEPRALLNDMNTGLYCMYRSVQQGRYPTPPTYVDSTKYMETRALFNLRMRPPVHDEETIGNLFYFLNKYSFNGLWRVNKRGEFNVPWNKKSNVPYPDFAPYRERLADWTLDNVDYASVALLPGDLIFADPPYDGTFSSYTAEGFSWPQQLEFARYLAGLNLPVVATNAATTRIQSLYRDMGFTVLTIEAPRRVASNGDRTPALEIVAHKNLVP